MDPLYREIGRKLLELRKALKLSQEEVAERAGIGQSYYGQLERGANIPSIKTLYAVAEALKTEPANLLPSPARPPHVDAIERLLEGLPEQKRSFVLGMVSDVVREFKAKK